MIFRFCSKKPFGVILILSVAISVFLSACNLDLSIKINDPSGQPTEELAPDSATELPSDSTGQDSDPTAYPYSDYAGPRFSDSNQRYLAASDLEQLSAIELLLARSEIFARHGIIFSDPELSAYFANQGWYQGSVAEDSFDQAAFNDHESANIQLIAVYEKIANGDYAPSADNPFLPYYDPNAELLLPKSSNDSLRFADLLGLDANQLIILRNQIIALHGYTFSSQHLMEYFLQCSWYRPSTPPGRMDLVQGLTEIELHNMECISEYEEAPKSDIDWNGLNTALSYQHTTEFFSVTVPEYWRDYAIVNQSSIDALPYLGFYEAPDYKAHHCGHLFTLMTLTADADLPYPQYIDLGVFSDGKNYFRLIALLPSDVQFFDENQYLYGKMSSELSGILKTLTLKPGYAFVEYDSSAKKG